MTLTRRELLADVAALGATPLVSDPPEESSVMPLAAGNAAPTTTKVVVPARLGESTVDVQLDITASAVGFARTPLQVGLSTAVEHYGKWHPLFPGIKGARVFSGPGEGLLPWSSSRVTGLPAGCEPWISFKDYPADAAFLAYVKACPRPTKLSWFHERDNNGGDHAARMDFFARQAHLAAIVEDAGNANVEFMSPPQTLQWTEAKSTADKVKGDGDWRLWWPGSAEGSTWDCYVGSWSTSYPAVETFFRIPVEAAEGTGRRLYVAELGVIRLPNDPTGSGRASWITDAIAYLREVGAAYVAWWCELGTGGRVLTLDDKPSADAWRAALNA